MQDRPSRSNLLETVAAFLRELMPRVAGADRFHARVSIHLLDILRRELELGEGFDREEARRLRELLGDEGSLAEMNRSLAAGIRDGSLDYREEKVFDHVLRSVEDKLRIVNPAHLRGED